MPNGFSPVRMPSTPTTAHPLPISLIPISSRPVAPILAVKVPTTIIALQPTYPVRSATNPLIIEDGEEETMEEEKADEENDEPEFGHFIGYAS